MKRTAAALLRAVFVGAVALTLWLSSTSAIAAGPSSPYWVTDGDNHVIYKIQGDVVQTFNTPDFPDREYPIAVTDTEIRTFGPLASYYGREYTPAGVPAGITYTNDGTFEHVLDGTTDGVNYNYAFQQNQGKVVRYDRNWANPQLVFTDGSLANDSEWGGITYDPTDNTLWVNRRGSTTEFHHYALDGSLIGSFSVPVFGHWGLAYDRGTDSLWFLGDYDVGVTTPIYNVSKTGTLLDTVILPVQMQNPLGGEMAIPEPASLSIVALACVPLVRRRRE